MMTSFDDNEDKVCSFVKDNVCGSCVRLRVKSYDPGSRDYGITEDIDYPFLLLMIEADKLLWPQHQ